MNLERAEQILSVVDQLGVASVKQMHEIIKIGSYRHTCRVISKLEPYLHVSRGKEKIVYLNKEGRELIGSSKEIKKSILFDHMLLSNDAFIYYGCPLDWKREYAIEVERKEEFSFAIQVKGLVVSTKQIVKPDAVFTRNGYVYLIEIDNTRTMKDNRKKIKKYVEMWQDIKKQFNAQPKLCIFTQSEKRKNEFILLCGKLTNEVYTFKEVR